MKQESYYNNAENFQNTLFPEITVIIILYEVALKYIPVSIPKTDKTDHSQ